MNAATVTRFARQLALPEVGSAGQERLLASRAVVVGEGLAAETAARYLAAAGVGTLRLVGGAATETSSDWQGALRGSNPGVALEHVARPADGAGWLDALEGASIVVREGFDDDACRPATVRRGVPIVVCRCDEGAIDVVAFRAHGPCPHAPLDVPDVAALPFPDGPGSVVAGTLAAAEALHVLLANDLPARSGRAHHLRIPLDGREATAQDIPWTPECFACGGTGNEMSFS